MGRFIAGADHTQTVLFPPCFDDLSRSAGPFPHLQHTALGQRNREPISKMQPRLGGTAAVTRKRSRCWFVFGIDDC